MISFRDYGYRMIGSAGERAENARRRYMGAGPLNLGPQYQTTSQPFVGEGSAPPPAHVLAFHLGPPPAAPPPPAHVIAFHLGPVTSAIPVAAVAVQPVAYTPPPASSDSADAPMPGLTPPTCPTCTKSAVVAGVASALGTGLLMYFVGLSTRERKAKRRRNRR